MDIFEMRLQGSTRRYPSGYLRVIESRRDEIGEETRRVSSIYISPATAAPPSYDICGKPVQYGSLLLLLDYGFPHSQRYRI
jgi:hypothetical protein